MPGFHYYLNAKFQQLKKQNNGNSEVEAEGATECRDQGVGLKIVFVLIEMQSDWLPYSRILTLGQNVVEQYK